MMHIEPIPISLLIHSIEYEEFIKVSTYDKEYKPVEIIDNVLVQPIVSIKKDSRGQEVQTKAVIFLDSVNTPNCKELKVDSKITFGSLSGTVIACEPLYTFDTITPHHYEVTIA